MYSIIIIKIPFLVNLVINLTSINHISVRFKESSKIFLINIQYY